MNEQTRNKQTSKRTNKQTNERTKNKQGEAYKP
jgi:hypothetical protein